MGRAAGERHDGERAVKSAWIGRILSDYLVLVLGLVYLAVVVPIRPAILDPRNLHQLMLAMTPLLVLGIGQMIVLVTGGIDLSLSAVVSLASVVGATLLVDSRSPLAGSAVGVPLAIAAMLLLGLAIGALHGISVTAFKMPAFLVTLVSMMFFSGLAVWYTQSQQISGLPSSIPRLWHGKLLMVPVPVIVAAAMAISAHLLLSHTAVGKRLYAVGHSAQAARVSGIGVRRTVLLAYAISGFCAALAGVLIMARLETGSPTLVPMEILLDCIGAVVLGGTSLFGGKGTVFGTLLGVFFITMVGNTLNMLGLGLDDVLLVKGCVIFLAALVDAIRTRFLAGG